MAINMFIHFEGGKALGNAIIGESTDEQDAKHTKWVEVSGFSHGVEQPTNPARSQSGATIEKCTHNPFEVTRKMDTSSVPMMAACWTGTIWDKIVFQAYRASGEGGEAKPIKYFEVTMHYAIVASYSVSGGEGDIPEETVSFNYGKIIYNYVPASKDKLVPTGAMLASHDLIKNEIG
jgi:type VI secretion system secreted protein Hcp